MKKKGLIVISDYYQDISKNLLTNCTSILKSEKYPFDIKTVSGSLEIPTLISYYIKNNKYSFYIALGCIIKGQTPHFDFISSAIVNSLLSLSISSGKPVTNGIITSLNYRQAIERSSKSKSKNKGVEAAKAATSILDNI